MGPQVKTSRDFELENSSIENSYKSMADRSQRLLITNADSSVIPVFSVFGMPVYMYHIELLKLLVLVFMLFIQIRK